MTALDDLRNAAGVEFDFAPGAQVPLSGSSGGRTGLSQRIASVAYREGSPEKIKEPNDAAKVNEGRFSLLEPNLGEAFTRAIETRMLADGRKPLIQSFGAEPQVVVEHALAAKRIRRQRDARLTVIMAVLGLLFLPGVAVWLGLFQLRRTFAGSQDRRAGALGTLLLVGIALFVALLVVRAPVGGVLQIYLWAMLPAPVIGWFLARQVSERTAQNLRAHWADLAGGGGSGVVVPEAVPQNPNDADAERLRIGLAKLAAEQESNLTYYAGTKGILGMGVRWGHWHLAEDLRPRDPGREIDPFRAWDVARAIGDQMRLLERGPLHTGGFTAPTITHWVVRHVGEGAGEVARPEGPNADGFRFSNIEVQRICNEQQYSAGDRHYLGVQFVLWDGELVITMMITVTVLHHTLRIEVSGYALGPLHGFFGEKPKPDKKKVRDFPRFWKQREVELPAVNVREAVRLAARAPLTWFPKRLDKLGGTIALPEPFGLRHTWATKPWNHRFMVDDVLRTATPVLRVALSAAFKVLRENGVDMAPFDARAQILSGSVQDPGPSQDDTYGM
ncbi:hypothetical protein FH609_022710 [Streptomyces sp. 3MP-14]|uniref:Uncharacterized protein n=1 Tax=Streptomyces mimosae TaxID=2586635 RepID=A0A5N6A3N5_9ACTN|nr:MULTISPECIES: hypothetical protein [Streptomyces]KAB8162579.1 hypothetical protein FH607_021300 [Streptomyces mimosae]KAB8174406.1 hypothetical protein FH609_022710 [Streptomyces sp. 3MP-14]